MKVVLRENESGVSEVVGTILILAMTVVLFSTIILWVSTIPTPTAQTRVDIQASLNPRYILQGGNQVEQGDWINMTHQGGESMTSLATVLYISDQKLSGALTTAVVHLAPFRIFNASVAYGMVDGPGQGWSVGQRFTYFSSSLSSSDTVTVTIVDLTRSLVLWSSQLTAPAGSRPPIFLNTYAARNNVGTPLDVQTNSGFYIFAQVMDPDGDLNPNSVFATITYYYGTGSCANPLKMYDDGRISVTGDAVAKDGLFTLFTNACTGNALAAMDGSIVLFNATDMKNHQTTTRMTLHVVPGTTGGNNNGGGIGGSGRPPNLRWNGNQGYNVFNASQWDTYGYAAAPTRTFKGGDTVVIVVGSLSLQNLYGIDQFTLTDPYSGNPAELVVYGATKQMGPASKPSTTSAFSFFQFVNGYYIYTYRFKLNDPTDSTVGVNFYTTPPQYPRYYYFASYPLSILLTDSANNRFMTTDSINVTADNGIVRTFPRIQTYSDPAFSRLNATFSSTATIYVQVSMLTTDLNTSMGNVLFGNVIIQDYGGGQELNRAPTNGLYSNLPICPVAGSCNSAIRAIWADANTVTYRFAINLARVNQDPWLAGTQYYALVLSSIKDSDESYSAVTTQISIKAPLYKMDLAVGADVGSNPAWATHNYALFYQDYNGYDIWKSLLVDYCAGGTSTSGISGGGNGKCPTATNVKLAYGDFWHDGTLGLAESITAGQNVIVIYRRTLDATGSVRYLPAFIAPPPPATCTAITTGDVTGNGLPSVICGGSNGYVWYYPNNGNWTVNGLPIYVDQPSSGQSINSIVVGDFNGDGWNDIAVGANGGVVKWYPNLGYGRFQNSGLSDNWFPQSEETVKGNISSGSYLNTYASDGLYEQFTEGLSNVPLQNGSNPNAFLSTNANWTSGTITATATQTYQASGGNPGGWIQVQTASGQQNKVPAGYWQDPFTVTGSQPFSATLNLSYQLSAYGATGSPGVTFRAFVESTSGAPNLANVVWTLSRTTATGWLNVNGISIPSTLLPTAGTYYLKVAMYTTCGATACGTTTGGFDNVVLSWTSTPGATSALENYWQIQQLPNRPNTAYTFNLRGHQTASSEDNFVFAYTTNVVGNDPTTGTYTTMFTLTATSDTSYPFVFSPPTTVAGKTIWIRVTDTNRVVGSTGLESLFVDQMYVNANTASGTTGVSLTTDGSAVNMIDAQDQNGDGIADLVAGTQNGKVYEYFGSAGGLLQPGSCFYAISGACATTGTAIVGVMFGNFSTAFPGLDIAVAFGTTVRIIRGDTGGVIMTALPAYTSGGSITAFAVGDINGDGWDDVAVGTASGYIFIWENLKQGTSWTLPTWYVDNLLAPIWSLVLGDTTNSHYMGR
jgi:flagellin-like protein